MRGRVSGIRAAAVCAMPELSVLARLPPKHATGVSLFSDLSRVPA